jgi:hypothetical protein
MAQSNPEVQIWPTASSDAPPRRVHRAVPVSYLGSVLTFVTWMVRVRGAERPTRDYIDLQLDVMRRGKRE